MSSEQARSRSERLGTTLFVAVLAHGIVILGVTFAPLSLPSDAVPSLKVTLLVDHASLERPPADAQWLAQRDAEARGSAADGARPTTALTARQPLTQLGDPAGADPEDGRPKESERSAEQIVTRAPTAAPLPAAFDVVADPALEPSRAAALHDYHDAEGLAAEIALRTELPGDSESRQGPASPAARASALAAYLDSWRRRVERIGTANFPRLPARRALRRPTLEVAIGHDGRLEDIVVRDSSGDPALDQAALHILRMAAPFEPLPQLIRADYNVLRFAYEWDFGSGSNVAALE